MSRHKRETGYTFPGFASDGGFTRVPDALFDTLLPHLGEAELKALLYIVRRTTGFNKQCDAIALSQFLGGIVTHAGKVLDEGCGVRDRTTLIAALRSLETMGVIESEKAQRGGGKGATTIYRLSLHPAAPTLAHCAAVSQPALAPSTAPARYPQGNTDASGLVSGNLPAITVGNSHVQDTAIQEKEGNNSKFRRTPPFFCVFSRIIGDGGGKTQQVAIWSGLPSTEGDETEIDPPGRGQKLPPLPPLAARIAPVIPTVSTSTLPLVPMDGVPPAQTSGIIPEKTAFIHQSSTIVPVAGDWGVGTDPSLAASERLSPRDPAFVPSLPPPVSPGCASPAQSSSRKRARAMMRPDEDHIRDQCLRYMTDYGRDFNDAASLCSSVSRLVNLYYRAGLPLDDFQNHVIAARRITQGRTSAIRTRAAAEGRKNKAAYFFAVLQNRLELREPPVPERGPDSGPYAGSVTSEWWPGPAHKRRAQPPPRSDRW